MKIVIIGKPYRYITEEKIQKVANRVFTYLKEKLPPVLRIEFNNDFTFQGNFYFDGHWRIGFCKIAEKEFNFVLTHELVHFIDYRKRGYKIWKHDYVFEEDILLYLMNPYEYHAESVAVKLYPVPYFVRRFKKVNKKMEEILNDN